MTFRTWLASRALVLTTAAFFFATVLGACFYWEFALVGMAGASILLAGAAFWLLTWVSLACLGLFCAPTRRQGLLACGFVLASAAVAYHAAWIGSVVYVLDMEREYLRRFHEARIALQESPPREIGGIDLDRSDDPPVRAAFYIFAAHGDVNGFVYDPTGEVVDPARSEAWLYGSRAHHLFGPWYVFSN